MIRLRRQVTGTFWQMFLFYRQKCRSLYWIDALLTIIPLVTFDQ